MSITVRLDSELPRPSGGHNQCEDNFLSAFSAGQNTAADWRQIIQAGLKCGMFTVAGRQWVDGVDAIKLTGHKPAAGTTIWVDPSSYLPVRLTGRVQLNTGGNEKQDATLTIDFRWLPPTRANLQGADRADPEGVPRGLLAHDEGPAAQRLRVTTHSTWWVIGNASNARSPSTRQPPAISSPRSRARVAGSQET